MICYLLIFILKISVLGNGSRDVGSSLSRNFANPEKPESETCYRVEKKGNFKICRMKTKKYTHSCFPPPPTGNSWVYSNEKINELLLEAFGILLRISKDKKKQEFPAQSILFISNSTAKEERRSIENTL